jgi:hypothetical protein
MSLATLTAPVKRMEGSGMSCRSTPHNRAFSKAMHHLAHIPSKDADQLFHGWRQQVDDPSAPGSPDLAAAQRYQLVALVGGDEFLDSNVRARILADLSATESSVPDAGTQHARSKILSLVANQGVTEVPRHRMQAWAEQSAQSHFSPTGEAVQLAQVPRSVRLTPSEAPIPAGAWVTTMSDGVKVVAVSDRDLRDQGWSRNEQSSQCVPTPAEQEVLLQRGPVELSWRREEDPDTGAGGWVPVGDTRGVPDEMLRSMEQRVQHFATYDTNRVIHTRSTASQHALTLGEVTTSAA